jgi:S-adenosylmethionine hydrolase
LKSPLITLLTDFGTQDYFVGAIKGVILSLNPNAQIVDITHDVPPQDIPAAAFNLLACYKDFPAATIHVAVVDPGVGSSRIPLMIECAGQFFVGPDNGIFSWICERERNWRAIHLHNEKFFRHPVSTTFHGRDVFAPVAAALSKGTPSSQLGAEVSDIVRLESLKTKKIDDGRIEGSVIYIDRFGNCITNLTREDLAASKAGAPAKLIVNGREITSFREFFADSGTDDEPFCVIGSAGFLEIAMKNSEAAAVLNVGRGDRVILMM